MFNEMETQFEEHPFPPTKGTSAWFPLSLFNVYMKSSTETGKEEEEIEGDRIEKLQGQLNVWQSLREMRESCFWFRKKSHETWKMQPEEENELKARVQEEAWEQRKWSRKKEWMTEKRRKEEGWSWKRDLHYLPIFCLSIFLCLSSYTSHSLPSHSPPIDLVGEEKEMTANEAVFT